MSEQNDFLKELEIKPEDSFEKPLVEEPETPVEEEKGEFSPKNRRERRQQERIDRLVKEATDNAARLAKLEQSREVTTGEEADFLKLVEPIFGTDTPEKREATEILKKALKGVHDSAEKSALEKAVARYEEERNSESQAVAEEEQNLDDMMEDLEDKYNVDFSDQATRNGFLTTLERLSPKDRDGNIIEYADPEAAYEIYASRKESGSNRAKELASRSMTRSGSSQPSKLQQDSMERFLKEEGII